MNKGIIRRARKDWDGSRAEFEEAVKSGLETKVPDLLGDIYHEYAIMLKASGETKAAKEQLTKALKIFEKVKATSRMERAKALLAEMGGDGQ
jgi:tetratricopeptide (TPR) repeat protein